VNGARAEVLLAGADNRAGLAVARSLARRGVAALLAVSDPRSFVLRSRHARHAVTVPSAVRDPDAFAERVLEAARRTGVRLLVPLSDEVLFALDRHRGALPEGAALAAPGPEAVRSVLDKRANLSIARGLGIPCPRQVELEDPEKVPELVARLGLPVVVKNPSYKIALDGRRRFPFRVLYARDAAELRRLVETHCADGHFPLFQEFVAGTAHNLCCFAVHGEMVALHTYVSMRRASGAGILREVRDTLPELAGHARRMLRALEWSGVAQLAFFVDEADGRPAYLETNGRFWASVQGSIDAGWDLPWWTYEHFLHGRVPEPGPLRLGSRTCWRAGDLDALVGYWRGGEPPTPGGRPGRLRALGRYLAAFRPGVHADVFRWSDPAPAWAEHRAVLADVLRRLLRRGRRRITRARSRLTGRRPPAGHDTGPRG